MTILFAVLERLHLKVFSLRSGHTEKFKFPVGKKKKIYKIYLMQPWQYCAYQKLLTWILWCFSFKWNRPHFLLWHQIWTSYIYLIFSKTWAWCKLIALCCQPLVQLNNQEYHFPLAKHLPRVPERRQALKNSSFRVLPNTLQWLWVPASYNIITPFIKYVPGKFPQELHSLMSTFYSGRL